MNLRSAIVADALDELGERWRTLAPGIRSLQPGSVLTGPALPVLVRPAEPGEQRAEGLIDAAEAITPGAVLVAAAIGEQRSAMWGELMTQAAHAAGAAGLVTTGLVRDSGRLVLPVFARGGHPASPDGRVQIAKVGEPVEVDGVRVEAGDCVVADDDGVVVVPATLLDRVEQLAARREEAEERVRAALAAGTSLRSVFSPASPGSRGGEAPPSS